MELLINKFSCSRKWIWIHLKLILWMIGLIYKRCFKPFKLKHLQSKKVSQCLLKNSLKAQTISFHWPKPKPDHTFEIKTKLVNTADKILNS